MTRHQLVITALAVGLAALFLGWVLGRSGDGEARTAGSAPATSVAPTVTPSTSTVTGDTLPAAELPSTTRPRPSTTTTLPPAWAELTVDIDARLADRTDRIVATGPDGLLLELDLGTGRLRSLDLDRIRSASGNPVVAGADWIMVRPDDGSSWQVFLGDSAEPEPFGVDDPWSTVWQYGTDTFWTMQYSPVPDLQRIVEVGLDARTTGREIDAGGYWPTRSDVAGGVIVGDESVGMFVADVAGSARLPGRPLALGRSHMVLLACGVTVDDCGLRVLDRATGELRPVPESPSGEPRDARLYGGWWGVSSGVPEVTDDGTAALVAVATDFGSAIAVIDLVTGAEVQFDAPDPSTTFVVPVAAWSSDERFAYVNDSGVLTAFDRETGESFPVVPGDDLPWIGTLTVRPA